MDIRQLAVTVTAAAVVGVGGFFIGGVVQSPKIEVRTVTKIHEVTPNQCLAAMENAEIAMGIAGDGFGLIGDMIRDIQAQDFEALDSDAEAMDAKNENEFSPALDNYSDAADKCKAARS